MKKNRGSITLRHRYMCTIEAETSRNIESKQHRQRYRNEMK